MCVSLLGGLGLGVLGAVVKDSTDRRVSHPDQVTRSMGLTILGAIPHVAVRGDDGIAPVIEAVRAARLNVTHVHGGGGPVVVTVTSPGKADGKSFVSSNLSLAFADAGYRTVLIDGDVRRGTQHHVLKAARQPGLTDYLAGRATLERVVQATPYPGLALIGCGQRTHAGPALLSSAAMVHLVAELRRDYDASVVDSAWLAGLHIGSKSSTCMAAPLSAAAETVLRRKPLPIAVACAAPPCSSRCAARIWIASSSVPATAMAMPSSTSRRAAAIAGAPRSA